MIDIFIAFWLTITPPQSLITDSTAVFLAEFQNQIPDSYLLNKNNYNLTDESGKNIPIIKIRKLNILDGIPIEHTKVIAYQTKVPDYKKVYKLNLIAYGEKTFYNNGYSPNLEAMPEIIINK